MGKTFLLSVFLITTLIIASYIIYRKIKTSKSTIKDTFAEVKKYNFVVFFFVITVLIYLPCSLFLANSKDMLISFWNIFPILLIPAIIVYIWLSVVLAAMHPKVGTMSRLLIFGLTLSVYVQSNFLNTHMPILNGREYSFFDYPIDVAISVIVWCVILSVSGIIFVKKYKILKILACILSAMQLTSLVVMVVINGLNSRPIVATTTTGEFELGTEENVILFVLDSIGGHPVEDYIKNNSEYESMLSDFTLFTDSMGGGASTQLGMPVILTGCEYDGIEDPEEYFDSVWEDTKLYKHLKNIGYDIRFFCTPGCVRNLPLGYVENIVQADDIYYIPEPLKYLEKIYTLSALYGAPQIVKSNFMLNTSDFEWLLGLTGENHIYFSEPRSFNNYWKEADNTVKTSYNKAFRYYHLDGVHLPIQWNEELEFDESATWEQAFSGQIRMLIQYMDSMKKLGIYDKSLIVICGDHGQEMGRAITINPAILIKRPEERHETIQYNSSPVTTRNLYSTIATISSEKKNVWGPTVYDIDENSRQQSLYTTSNQMAGAFNSEGVNFKPGYVRVIPGNTFSGNSDAEVWNPYSINVYNIDMSMNENASININEVSPENTFNNDGKIFLGEEFTCCIKLDNYSKNDLKLQLDIGEVLGDNQEIKVWVNGHRLDSDTDNVQSYVVSKSIIDNDVLYVRLVMPMALTPKMINENSTDTRVMSLELNSITISRCK